MAKKKNSVGYVEPVSYFSKEARKAAGIGEYAKKTEPKKKVKRK